MNGIGLQKYTQLETGALFLCGWEMLENFNGLNNNANFLKIMYLCVNDCLSTIHLGFRKIWVRFYMNILVLSRICIQ